MIINNVKIIMIMCNINVIMKICNNINNNINDMIIM